METADGTRARLRHELRQAYAAWLLASERNDFRAAGEQRENAGADQAVRDLWASYLAAREKLIEAVAGASGAGSNGAGTRGTG